MDLHHDHSSPNLTKRSSGSTNYLDHLKPVAESDVEGLLKAQQSYGDSWKRRGGVGAFMMLARKWDRLEKRLAELPRARPELGPNVEGGDRYDIFHHIEADRRSEGVIDDIRDLRRYLTLVEAEARARGINPDHRDNAPDRR